MGTFIVKRKTFTLYDETDNLKRMKDSDILAEKEKSTNYAPVVGSAITGAAVGAGGLAAAGAVKGFANKGSRFKSAAKSLKGGAKVGAILGAGIAGGIALHKKAQEQEENTAYNNRLNYAQTQARRREKQDWKTNMTTRDGYSY